MSTRPNGASVSSEVTPRQARVGVARPEAEAEIIRDAERVLDFARELTLRYASGIESIAAAAAALEAQAPKRVAIHFHPVRTATRDHRTATWDHRKLGGTY